MEDKINFMKQIIPFSRYFIPAAILSFLLLVTGVFGLFRMGFNMGIDFRPGLLLEVQIAPSALHMTYDGPGNAIVSLSRTSLDFFKQQAKQHNTAYQKMIRNLLDVYAASTSVSERT